MSGSQASFAVELERVSRTYRARSGVLRRRHHDIEAVREVSLGIGKGELFGLLGPNGAGKTTIVKMLTTLLTPTSGTARVLGLDVVTQARAVRRSIGYVFGGDRGLYDRLSAYDNLRFFAELYSIAPREQRRRIASSLESVGLAGREKERVEGFSRGMRQRLHIARGLLHDPPVVFLDEPSIGIDPVGARMLRATIAALAAAGRTVLLTTHSMYEADELCDRVAIIQHGSIIAEGTPDEVKARAANGTVVEIVVADVPDDVVRLVSAIAGVRSVVVEARDQDWAVVARTEPAAEVTSSMLGCLAGGGVRSVLTRAPTLEDAYVNLVSSS